MLEHDSVRELSELIGNTEILKKVSPKFAELNMDIQEVMEHSKDPVFIAVLLFKLAQEREKTNQLLEKTNEKYDSIMLRLKTTPSMHEQTIMQPIPQPSINAFTDEFGTESVPLKALPEHDQLIVHLAFEKGQISADDIKKELGYKGKNAASQRLNKLFREGHLKKIQAGRKVVYLARNI